MSEYMEKFIRYVDEMAGNGFDDARELMMDSYEKFGIDINQPSPLEKLIKKMRGY